MRFFDFLKIFLFFGKIDMHHTIGGGFIPPPPMCFFAFVRKMLKYKGICFLNVPFTFIKAYLFAVFLCFFTLFPFAWFSQTRKDFNFTFALYKYNYIFYLSFHLLIYYFLYLLLLLLLLLSFLLLTLIFIYILISYFYAILCRFTFAHIVLCVQFCPMVLYL